MVQCLNVQKYAKILVDFGHAQLESLFPKYLLYSYEMLNLDRMGHLILPDIYYLMKFLKNIRTVRLKYYTLESQCCEVQSPLLDTYLPTLTKYFYEWTRYLKMNAIPLERSAFHGCSFRHYRVMAQFLNAQNFAKFLVDLGNYSWGW